MVQWQPALAVFLWRPQADAQIGAFDYYINSNPNFIQESILDDYGAELVWRYEYIAQSFG